VEAVIEERGGDMVLGWMLYQKPNYFLCAEHHAVWRMPNGELRDVTAKNVSIKTSFIISNESPLNLDRAPNIRTRYVSLDADPALAQLFLAYAAFYDAQAILVDWLYLNGYRCESQRGLARGVERPWDPGLTEAQRRDYALLEANRQEKLAAMAAYGSASLR
jgi:hypothetical protein